MASFVLTESFTPAYRIMSNSSPSSPASDAAASQPAAGRRFIYVPFTYDQDKRDGTTPSIRETAANFKNAVAKINGVDPAKVPIVVVEGGVADLEASIQGLEDEVSALNVKQQQRELAVDVLKEDNRKVQEKRAEINANKPPILTRVGVLLRLVPDPQEQAKKDLKSLKEVAKNSAANVSSYGTEKSIQTAILNATQEANSLRTVLSDCRQGAELLKQATQDDTVYVMGHSAPGAAGDGRGLATSTHQRLNVDQIADRMRNAVGGDVGKIKVWGCHSGLDVETPIDKKTGKSKGVNHSKFTTSPSGSPDVELKKSTARGLVDALIKSGDNRFQNTSIYGYEDTVTLSPTTGKREAKVPIGSLSASQQSQLSNNDISADGKYGYVRASDRRVTVRDATASKGAVATPAPAPALATPAVPSAPAAPAAPGAPATPVVSAAPDPLAVPQVDDGSAQNTVQGPDGLAADPAVEPPQAPNVLQALNDSGHSVAATTSQQPANTVKVAPPVPRRIN